MLLDGGSEGFEKLHSFSLSDYVDDVLEVMARLQEKPVLIGHSMGSAVVQKIAHVHPDKIKAVILLASVPHSSITILTCILWLNLILQN